MESYKRFENELFKLEQLYGGTIFAYWEAKERYSRRINEGFPERANKYQQGDKFEVVISNTKKEYDSKMSTVLPRYLRETIFVRLISVLEIYLVDVVKEIFLLRRDLFHKEDRVEMSFRQLLSFDTISTLHSYLINKETRNIQNQGFRKVKEYYKKRFNIDFMKFKDDINALIEFHDRRNLLVHRLGQVDEIYRKKYGVSEKFVSISKNDIVRAIQIISEFGAFICNETQNLISYERKYPSVKDPRCLARVVLKTPNNEYVPILDKNFFFYCGEELIQIKDLLYRYNYDRKNKLHILKVSGSKAHVLSFINETNKVAETGLIELINSKVIIGVRKLGYRSYVFSRQLLYKIKNELPEYPWPKDIHKEIAKKCCIKEIEAFFAIRKIMSLETGVGEPTSPNNRLNGRT